MITLRIIVLLLLFSIFSLSVIITSDRACSKDVALDPRLMYPELQDAVRLGPGTLEEAVSYESEAGDVFFVPMEKWETVVVNVVLESGEEIRISTFFLDEVRRDLNSFTVTGDKITNWNWKNNLGVEGLYLKVEGWGQYRLEVHKERDLMEVFMKEYLNLSLLLMIIVGIILAILLLSASIYLRTISYSISHGFEHEHGKATKIADRSHRYDQLPFHKLPDGTERMVLPRMDPCAKDLSQYDTEQVREMEQECERIKRYRTNAMIIANRPIRPKKVIIDGREHLREVANAPIMPIRRDLHEDVRTDQEQGVHRTMALPTHIPDRH